MTFTLKGKELKGNGGQPGAWTTFRHHSVCNRDSARSTNKDMHVCCFFLCVCVLIYAIVLIFARRLLIILSWGSHLPEERGGIAYSFLSNHRAHTHKVTTHTLCKLGRGDTVYMYSLGSVRSPSSLFQRRQGRCWASRGPVDATSHVWFSSPVLHDEQVWPWLSPQGPAHREAGGLGACPPSAPALFYHWEWRLIIACQPALQSSFSSASSVSPGPQPW